MAKCDLVFKLVVVKAYLNGEDGYSFLAKRFNIASDKSVSQWVKLYQAFGKEALEHKLKNQTYSVQFKLDVLNHKLRTGKSFQDVAIAFGMTEKIIN